MILYRAKGRLWPAMAHLLTVSLRSLLRHFAPPTNANYARSELFAKANIGFRLFAAGLGPRANGVAVATSVQKVGLINFGDGLFI